MAIINCILLFYKYGIRTSIKTMRNLSFFLLSFCIHFSIWSQNGFETKYPNIPRIDVHSHAGGDITSAKNYINVRNWLKSNGNINVTNWINLGNREFPIQSFDEINEVSENRMLFAKGNYAPNNLTSEFDQATIKELKDQGYIGYKLWFGPYQRRFGDQLKDTLKYVNDERLSTFFKALYKHDFPLTSLHIADPNGVYGDRTKWFSDPVEFWRNVRAFEDLLKDNPDIVVLTAHGVWLMVQDAQLDYLRYLLASYPNFYIDLAATYQYFNRVNRDNLRDLIINYSDRILFATDVGTISDDSIERIGYSYMRCFEILETDNMVEGGFFGTTPLKGLLLPEKTLEDIYYKNAMRLFPSLKVH